MKADGVNTRSAWSGWPRSPTPSPWRELLARAFGALYCQGVPWARDYELLPKSVLRDMVETASDFKTYIGRYGIAKSEGTLLRYLSDAFACSCAPCRPIGWTTDCAISSPGSASMVRTTDSSRWWTRGRAPASCLRPARPQELADAVVADRHGMGSQVRNALFARVRLAALDRTRELGNLDEEWGHGERAWNAALDDYFAEHNEIRLDSDARSAAYLMIDEGPEQRSHAWHVRQIFLDEEDAGDFRIEADVDLRRHRDRAKSSSATTASGLWKTAE
ncbi:MAG: DUF3516 domain-containing protein [Adlercreutzia equolifaciens]